MSLGKRSLPLHLFGGWLLFFFIIGWIGIVSGLFGCLILITRIVKSQTAIGIMIFYLTILIERIIVLILAFYIVKIVKIKETNIPERIVRLLTWMVVFSIGFLLLEITLSDWFFGSASLKIIKLMGGGVGRELVPWLIWSNYFMRSKRVAAYYGKGSSRLLKF